MFKPARMTRILVGGHKDRMREVVETLHEEGVLHIEDYRDPAGLTEIGEPMEDGEAVSDLLVRVRGLQKAIDAPAAPPRKLAAADWAKPVNEAETALDAIVEARAQARADLAAVEAEIEQLSPLRGLDVDVGALHKVKAVRAFTGTVREDPAGALERAGIQHELTLHKARSGFAALLLVRTDDASSAERALAEAGFTAAQVPDVNGTPEQARRTLHDRLLEARAAVASAEADVRKAAQKWAGRLSSLEAHLAAEAAKTAVPLQFGVTPNTFHLEGWVPLKRLNHVRNVVAARFGEGLYLEDVGDEQIHAGHGDKDDHHETSAEDEAPTALRNKGPARSYEFMLSLLALPRYKELDPTKLIAIFFPIFFGLMVGDFLIGLIIMGIALWLRKGNIFGIGGNGVAKPMFWGGFWAMLIGAVIFGEALGMHFVLSEEALEDGEHSWESVLGVHFPEEGFIHKTGGHDAPAAADGHAEAPDVAAEGIGFSPHASEADAQTSLLAPHGGAHLSVNGWFNLGYYSKIHDVQALLVISVIIGIVHLILGFFLGIRNVYAMHGAKLAIQEKASWLGIMASVPLIVFGMDGAAGLLWGGVGLFLVAVALLWMGVQHTIGVGFIAILEIPSLLGNILSYTRLAAIGASKAGMAIAFATIGFELIGGIGGWIVYLLAAVLITLLAILAGFLQSLRLQFVEFFSKFYEGGGRPYLPFGRRST